MPDLSVELLHSMQPESPADSVLWMGQPRGLEEFKQMMRDDQRLIYQFEIERAYGMYS